MKKYLEQRIKELDEEWELNIRNYRKAKNHNEREKIWEECAEIEIRIDELKKVLEMVK